MSKGRMWYKLQGERRGVENLPSNSGNITIRKPNPANQSSNWYQTGGGRGQSEGKKEKKEQERGSSAVRVGSRGGVSKGSKGKISE